ncbi:MAG: hypothetical protein HY922_02825 [Elusimicrobia bacterium]|nr:hypothetical protein [Elusimicrobiota bacterium]
MSGKLIGWIIILAALAVPAFLFYNWLGKMKAQTQPIEVHRKPEGGAFGGAGSQVRPSTGAAAGDRALSRGSVTEPSGEGMPLPSVVRERPASEGLPGAAAAVSTWTVSAAPSAPAPQPQNPENPAAAAAAQAAQDPGFGIGVSQAAAQAAASAKRPGTPTVEYNPSTQRDPTISPVDLKKMAVEKQRKDLIEAEMRDEALNAKKPKKKEAKAEPSCEERLQLFGIISMPSGNAAIVNNSTVREGDAIEGAVVKKITTGTVVFQCRGRPIIKKVSK